VHAHELIGESPAFRELLARAKRVAPWPLPVLVTGESGSGKEGIARTLHRSSPRRRGPFVALNCAAVTETLLESELFGAIRGAYTGLQRDRPGLFKLAHGGTLLLDEVGDMSPGMQAKLLRVLQDGRVRAVGGEVEEPVDVRVVAATHQDLHARVETGLFRQDLYYRLAVVELRTPPLRDRPGDIPLLTRHLSAKLARRIGAEAPEWTPMAMGKLEVYDWPGNIRELEAVVARALLHGDGGPIRPRHVDLPREAPSRAIAAGDGLEARMIEAALRQNGGVASHAAAAIGWSRQKLARRMAALGIRYPASCSTREMTSSHSSTPQEVPSRKAPHSS
jgi:sigma-54-dependent transcriptional regulator